MSKIARIHMCICSYLACTSFNRFYILYHNGADKFFQTLLNGLFITQEILYYPSPPTLEIRSTYTHKKPNPTFKIYLINHHQINLKFYYVFIQWIKTITSQVANHLVMYELVLFKKQHTLIHMMKCISNIKKNKEKGGQFVIMTQTRWVS